MSRQRTLKFWNGCGDKGVGRKNFRGVEANGKKTRSKNSIIEPSLTLSVSCMKIQGGTAPCCRRPWVAWLFFWLALIFSLGRESILMSYEYMFRANVLEMNQKRNNLNYVRSAIKGLKFCLSYK